MLSPALLIAALCFTEVLSMLAFATFPTLIPVFQDEWGLNNTAAGWISGIYFAGYVVAVGILTALTDRVDPKKVYLFSMVVSVVGALGYAGLADGVISASVWRFLQGIGLAGTYMPGLKALTDVIPQRLQSRAVAFYTSSFGVGASLSYYLSGVFNIEFGWRWTFALCAIGPLIAFFIALFILRSKPPSSEKPTTHLLDFRPVIANRKALGFTLAYAAHNAELFGFRSWIVVFLVFSQAQQEPDALGLAWSAATIAALLNLIGMPASVMTNEIAHHFGRRRTLFAIMGLSAIVAVLFGFSATAPFWLVLLIAVVYAYTITGDSATITAGAVAAADPRYRGSTMAFYSLIGFIGSFIGPLLFGVVLDLGGGSDVPLAWGMAFSAMALTILLGPLAVAKFVRDS